MIKTVQERSQMAALPIVVQGEMQYRNLVELQTKVGEPPHPVNSCTGCMMARAETAIRVAPLHDAFDIGICILDKCLWITNLQELTISRHCHPSP